MQQYKLSFSNLSFICYAIVPCRSSLPHWEAWWRKKTRMILLLILISAELSTNLNRSKKVISYFIVQILKYIPDPLSSTIYSNPFSPYRIVSTKFEQAELSIIEQIRWETLLKYIPDPLSSTIYSNPFSPYRIVSTKFEQAELSIIEQIRWETLLKYIPDPLSSTIYSNPFSPYRIVSTKFEQAELSIIEQIRWETLLSDCKLSFIN